MALHQRQIGLKSIENVDWSGKKILDVGCSNGELSFKILEKTKAKELIGIDPNPDRISRAIELAKSKNLENVHFYVARSENLSFFSDNSFDAIFCNMAFQQFKEPQKSLFEMFRVLKNGGQAIINFNIEKSPTWMQHEILFNKYYGDPNKKITAEKTVNEKNFSEMAKNAGFSDINLSKKDDTNYYKSFEEILHMMDTSFLSDKKLDKEQEIKINEELKNHLESTRTSDGIPETWKIIFGKLIK